MSRPDCELVGVGEIADLLGVSKQRVDQLRRDKRRRVLFPEPIAELRAGPVWAKRDVVAWDNERKGK